MALQSRGEGDDKKSTVRKIKGKERKVMKRRKIHHLALGPEPALDPFRRAWPSAIRRSISFVFLQTQRQTGEKLRPKKTKKKKLYSGERVVYPHTW